MQFTDRSSSVLHAAQARRAARAEREEAGPREQRLQKIKDAATSSAKRAAVAEFLAKWELPPDHDVLVEVLACDDDEYVATALKIVDGLLSSNRPPRRTTTLEQRLKRIVTLSEEPSVQATAKELIK